MISPYSRIIAAALAAPIFTSALLADVRLPSVISDHMVLQAASKANVWGWADAGEKVSVRLLGRSAETIAAPDGTWNVRFEDLKSGESGDMTVTGKNELAVKDVIVGEVWVASGQSNMEWTVQGAANPEEEKANANWPAIRMYIAERRASDTPLDDCKGKWLVCSPTTVGGFSAVGYYFARHLHQKLKQPMGILHSSWGGTNASLWTPLPVIEEDPKFSDLYIKAWQKVKADYPAAKAKYDEAMAKWKTDTEEAKAAGKELPKQPRGPRGGDAFGSPACLYNSMIHPLLKYTMRGAIWYQGESNASDAEAFEYRRLFPSMITAWRAMWARNGNAGAERLEFPFLFVQLANFMQRAPEPINTPWAVLRESQLETLELANTGMAVAIDIGEANDIHPKNKQEVGRRLALNAEALVYFQETPYSGPIFTTAQPEDGKVRLSFRFADELRASDGGALKGFAIAGEDKKFVWAEAEIQGDHIVVSAPSVPNPVAVRYAWANNPECNLVNASGIPASPFRTDNW